MKTKVIKNTIIYLAIPSVLLLLIALICISCKNRSQNNYCQQEISSVTDVDGNVYPVVIIGDQVWMAENLRTTTYSVDTDILTNLSGIDWKNDRSGACIIFSHYMINGLDSDSAVMATYGVSYIWHYGIESNEYLFQGMSVEDIVVIYKNME